ncbi:peptidylprolyl isomerase [Sphingomonas sp. KR1UV-12]|uniref:Parvulin-like PPIase n=2 Tax=Sphingomonas aurea TaxID=3063994 RepID=A0ABT9EGP9_9SPHN|nr:peptidylprolyl isomerase [Sphingomonas sp. KR1UV-12]MDP1026147.1 peptidylprolyl isomerase [Sphingomonas sp. KR1UV-12]
MLAVLAGGAVAQQPEQSSAAGLDLPANLEIFGKLDPNVRKPTAIVNEHVITGTDVDQRVALILAANNTTKLPQAELDRLKLQVLRQLIDETLQIQEAKTADITITRDELQQSYDRIAQNFNRTPAQMAGFLRDAGSSERSLKRQIEGELAWQRYLRRKVEPSVNIGEAEVKAILDRLEAAKGTEEYNLREIYLSANDATAPQVLARAKQIIAEIQKAQQPFGFFARQYSEASTRGVDGDLGWVRAAQLPTELAASVQQMQPGQVAGPIPIPGGFSIIALADKRQVLTADPRDARLSLKQLTLKFPPGLAEAQAAAKAAAFGKALSAIQGCGTVAKVAATIGAEVVDNDAIRVRDLPPQLAEIMLQLQVGQATPPFGSREDGVRALVLCGRDDPKGGQLPSSEQVENQLQQQRVNLRSQQKLRDLRRDAVVEYR